MSQVITFEKVVPEGKAMGHLSDGRAVFTVGPLPEEVARVGVRKQKKTYAEATLREIITPSRHRTGTPEDHALSCSPWQDVEYAYQLELKRQMLTESFAQHKVEIKDAEFVGAEQQLGCRNRLDYTVAEIDGTLQLAFHQRGSWDNLVALPKGCALGSDEMNIAALALVERLNKLELPVLPATITVRHARTTDQLLTILTTELKTDWQGINTTDLGNFIVARPLPGSGAPGEIVFQSGDSYITEELQGVKVSYPGNSFFQTNTPVFDKALEQIIAAAKGSKQVVELYSGVGAIGLPLAKQGIPVKGIEIVAAAVEFAERNARANDITTYQAEAVAAEKMDEKLLEGADTIILDPPRAGLHPRVTKWILGAQPKTIIYLSCNPVTQARDIAAMSEAYKLESITGFDFYPGALHLESLAILKKK